jgi:hypothetical protein
MKEWGIGRAAAGPIATASLAPQSEVEPVHLAVDDLRRSDLPCRGPHLVQHHRAEEVRLNLVRVVGRLARLPLDVLPQRFPVALLLPDVGSLKERY